MSAIFKAINEVRKAVSYIQKDSDVSFGSGSYKAVSHDNVVATLREEVVKQGIIIIPSLVSDEWFEPRKGKDKSQNWLYTAIYEITFACGDGSSFTAKTSGHANDSGDKAAGKALSYAVKSAMLKVFMLETGVDDESRNFDPTEYTDEQKGMFDELLAAKDAFGYFCYIQTMPEVIRKGLYNSFEHDKTKMKELCRILSTEGAEKMQNTIDTIKSMIDKDDPAVIEITDEMEIYEKQIVIKQLRKGDIDYLSKLSKGV